MAALFSLSLLAVSCGPAAKEETLLTPAVSIKSQTVSGEQGSQFVSVTASGGWTITTNADWLTITPSSGSGSTNMVILEYSANTVEVRSAVITLNCSNGSASVGITQNKKTTGTIVNPGDDPGEDPGGDPGTNPDDRGYGTKTASQLWLELPGTSETDGLEFFTHNMKIGGTLTRNYSYYWDYDNMVSVWVAYPLSGWNIGSGKRTDAWGIDPLLPERLQPVLFNAYSGGYSRGHQIPSADRLTYEANVQTFYGTNMTPQDYNFNGGTWANLEGKVRTWANRTGNEFGTDTLYVVSGCIVGDDPKRVSDNYSKSVAVPDGYFKALLRYRNNPSAGHQGFMACAFYFDNENKYASKVSKEMSMSVADLEKKLGYRLFVNLDAKVGAETARTIKEENPAEVTWWWQN